MSVEADCFRIRMFGEDTLIRSDRVLPGASEVLPYLKKIKILATCDVDGSSGTVRLSTSIRRNRKLSVMLFEDPNDIEGRKISYDQPITITGEQELSILYKTEKKEVLIFLDQENHSEDKKPPVDADRLIPIA